MNRRTESRDSTSRNQAATRGSQKQPRTSGPSGRRPRQVAGDQPASTSARAQNTRSAKTAPARATTSAKKSQPKSTTKPATATTGRTRAASSTKSRPSSASKTAKTTTKGTSSAAAARTSPKTGSRGTVPAKKAAPKSTAQKTAASRKTQGAASAKKTSRTSSPATGQVRRTTKTGQTPRASRTNSATSPPTGQVRTATKKAAKATPTTGRNRAVSLPAAHDEDTGSYTDHRTERTPHLGDDLLEQFADFRARTADTLECPKRTVGRPSRRAKVLIVCMFLCMVTIAYTLAKMQVVDPQGLREKAAKSRTDEVPLPAPRGEILDRNGVVLAATVQRYTLECDPQLALKYDPEKLGKGADPNKVGWRAAARDIAAIVPDSEEKIYKLISLPHKDPKELRRWQRLAKEVSLPQWQEIRALGIPSLTAIPNNRREYPAQDVAGSVLGFVQKNEESAPGAGLELMYDKKLRGIDGLQIYERGRGGERIPLGDRSLTPAQPGQDITLTLDRDIQWYAQKHIADQVQHHGAEWGSVIVQDVKTGELLAVAQSGEPNPGEAGNLKSQERRAHAFQSVIEPGSTAKVATVAAALDDGVITSRSKFKVPDVYTAKNGQKFKDSSPHDVQKLTVDGIMAESSNTGTIMIAEKMPKADRYNWLKKFGVGSTSGVRFPGESAGLLRPADKWDKRTELQVMFGQGYAVTPIQASQVLSIIANDGVHMPPRLVKTIGDRPVAAGAGISDDDKGNTASNTASAEPPAAAQKDGAEQKPQGTRVVSAKSAQTVSRMLESVVTDGTAPQAVVPGYRVAGKTGTAEHASGRKGYDGYTSSFIGFAPAEAPRFMVSVIVHRPTQNGHYGGVVAGPVFSKVMGYSLQKFGVAPATEPAKPYPLTWK